jgi:hypothetical protein
MDPKIAKINFDDLSFEKFRSLANNDSLSRHEKVGFPDSYREGKEPIIFSDLVSKMRSLEKNNLVALEIGPGCSRLPLMLADHCLKKNGVLHFIDSEEMLKYLPSDKHIHKWPGCFPNIPSLFEKMNNKVDSIVVYSVIQYVFSDGNLWEFVDRCLSLLSEGGELFLGDIPNTSMRKRFFRSNAGLKTHQEFSGQIDALNVEFNILETGRIDDAVVFGILARARSSGFHSWVLPQGGGLPMENRREDILIRRP